MATTRAEKIEETLARARQRGWKQALGAGHAADGSARAPTRLAYQWAKGVAGWTRSCLGSRTAAQDAEIQEEWFDEEQTMARAAEDDPFKESEFVQMRRAESPPPPKREVLGARGEF